jgi:hypothetical protein
MQKSCLPTLAAAFAAASFLLSGCGSDGDGGAAVIAAQPLGILTVAASAPATSATSVTLTGTAASDEGLIVVAGGAAAAQTTAGANRAFSVEVPLTPNKANVLFLTEYTADGAELPPANVVVVQDGGLPNVFVDAPPDGATVTTASTCVAGRVADLLSGFMGLSVTVNGVAAIVEEGIGTNGTFLAAGVPLAIGANTVTATATDAVGNVKTASITVNRVDPTGQPVIVGVSGDQQTAAVHAELPLPIRVQCLQADGSPFANRLVTFTVTQSDGRVFANTGETGATFFQTFTDVGGFAECRWRLGGDAGCGNNRVTATAGGLVGEVFFAASANPGPAAQINVGSGTPQTVAAGAQAPMPLIAWVSDACNGIGAVPVTFTVVEGDGLLVVGDAQGAPSVLRPTASTGHAEVAFVAGPTPGVARVEANFAGHAGSPATFTLQILPATPGAATSFVGVVLDNARNPMQGVTATLRAGGVDFATTTTAFDGRFTLTDLAQLGPQHLFIDGGTATHVNGVSIDPNAARYPYLEYDVFVHAETENALVGPILLPKLNPANDRNYSTTQDTVLTCLGIEGLTMTIAAGSMTLPGGQPAPNGTLVSLNQVHHDKVPMPMPDGVAPPFAWTLQPAGAHFDPPVKVQYPNMTGLPAGAVTNFLSFDHATGAFEIVASGRVLPDGSASCTDPGAGLTVAGWGCNCPPYSVTAQCVNCSVSIAGPANVCPGVPVVFTANPNLPGGTFSWSGGTPTGPSDQPVYETVFSAPGSSESVTCTYTCLPEDVQGFSSKLVSVDPVGELRFESLENPGQFLPAFDQSTQNGYTPNGFFRFLVGDVRKIKVRFCPNGDPFENVTCHVTKLSGTSAAPSPASGAFQNGEFAFTPAGSGRTIGNDPIPAVSYLVEAKNAAGAVVASAVIEQDLIDRLRQEYIDHDQQSPSFRDTDPTLVNGVPPRNQIVVAPSAQIGGTNTGAACVGTCRSCTHPNYFDPTSGIGLTWNNGNVGLFQSCAALVDGQVVDTTAGSLEVCFHSGHRSPSHNKKAGSVAVNSNHQFGRAVDMSYDAPSSGATAPSAASRARFHLLLYRAALLGTPGEVLIEKNSDNLVPKRWNPPGAGHTFDAANQGAGWPAGASVTIDDSNADDLPDQVDVVVGTVPSSTNFKFDGGIGSTSVTFRALDANSNGSVDAGETLIRNFANLAAGQTAAFQDKTLDEVFANASHVHGEGFLAGGAGGGGPAFPGDPFVAGGVSSLGGGATIGSLDGTWTVTANGQTVPVDADGGFSIANIVAADQFGPNGPGTVPDNLSDDFVRITGVSHAGGKTRYAFNDPFQIANGTTKVVGSFVITDQPPLDIESLAVTIADNLLDQAGQTTQLTTTATLAGGSTVDVTPRTARTVYRTSNPAIATVGQDGLVTGVGLGTAFLTAGNQGATAVVKVTVVPGDPLTTLIGVVRDEQGAPAVGLTVLATPGALTATTDANGAFSIAGVPTLLGKVRATTSTLVGTDTFTAASVALDGVPAGFTDVGVLTLLPGILNGGFELGDFTNWTPSGNAFVVQNLGTGVDQITPPEGLFMAYLSTDPTGVLGAVQGTFAVPSGVSQLLVSLDYFTDESLSTGSFQDRFEIRVGDGLGGLTTVFSLQPNSLLAGGAAPSLGAGGGLSNHTGFLTVPIDVSAFAGGAMTLELCFNVTDIGDTVVESAVLLDDLRFASGP